MSDGPRNFDDLDLRSDDRSRDDLREEMEAHIQHRIDDLRAEGVDADEAERRARAEFGDVRAVTREVDRLRARRRRSGRARGWLDGFVQDLRFAVRQFARRPGFALGAALTLALGIGATSGIASVVRAVVLEPLPFEAPARLVDMEMLTPARQDFSVAEPAYLEWRDRLETFAGVGAMAGRGATLRAPGEPTSIQRGYVSAGFFDLLGAELRLGREFAADEDEPGNAAPVAIVSERFWRSRLEADRVLEGRTVQLDDRTLEVVGVYPDELEVLFGDAPVITPLAASPQMDRGEHYLMVIGRLADGVAPETATAELERLAAWQSETWPEDRGWSAKTTPLTDVLVDASTRRAGWVLLAAAALLLAMACLNVSSLLLARGTMRAREIGVRAAIGADVPRILRQLLTESAVLAVTGAVLGLGLASLALPQVRELAIGRIPRIESAVLDPWMAVIATVVAVAATFLFGVVPIVRGRRASTVLRDRGGSGRRSPLRAALVTGQLAVSLVLLLGTGLLFRSFVALSSIDPGFEPEGTLTLPLSMPDGSWSWQERGPLVASIVDAVEAVPGVRRAGATAVDPFSGMALANFVAREDRMPDRASEFTPIHWRVVTPGYWEAIGTRIIAGRGFEDADADDEPGAVVIGARLAGELFGTPEEAVGRLLVWGDPTGSRLRVVGVAEVFRDVELAEQPERMMYRMYAHIPWAAMTLVVRLDDGAGDVAPAIREAVRGAAPGLPVPELRSLQASVDRALAEPRFNAVLLAAFAFAGLALAVIGVWGLTAFEVRGRFREIGIRLSLGARPEAVRRMIVRERLVLTAVGTTLGAVGAWLLSGLLGALLYGVTPLDPLTWIFGIALLTGTATLAAWIPARRATKVDPREVLSSE